MTGIFKVNNPSGNVILFFYALVLKLPMFLNVYSPRLQASDGILYKYFLETTAPVAKVFPYFYSLLAFLLLFLLAVSLNRIVNNQRLHKSPNYLTGMSFLLITSLFSELFSLSAPLIVNIFILWLWGRLCSFYINQNPKPTIFNLGLVAGIAAFFYLPSVPFLFPIFRALTF